MTKSNKNTKTKKNAQQQHNRKINRFPNQRKPDNTKNRPAQPRNEFRKYKKADTLPTYTRKSATNSYFWE